MKIFEDDMKVNFVDENNVFVGYDMFQQCCEDAGWFIGEEINQCPAILEKDQERILTNYNFDREFFEELETPNYECGGIVVFKLSAVGKRTLYLHLYNAHNGYYSHGFSVKVGGEVVRSGEL